MLLCSSVSTPQTLSPFSISKPFNGDNRPVTVPVSCHIRASADVPNFLFANWLESRRKRPFGPILNVTYSLSNLVRKKLFSMRQDYGIEVMYRFAGFDPFERSTYSGLFFDLGQFEKFRRIFHHSTYRVLLGHKDRKIDSSSGFGSRELAWRKKRYLNLQ